MSTIENNQNQLTTTGVDDKNNSEAAIIAEASYQRLRDAVGRYVAAAIQSGKLLFQEKVQPVPGSGGSLLLYGPVQFSHWHAHLPEETKQHYNCDYCKTLWASLSTLCAMDDDGNIYYPVAAAFLECADDPIVANLFAGYPEVKEACGDTMGRRAVLMPIDKLPDQLLEKTVGGFCHFFGVQDKEIIREYNKTHQAMNDQMYLKKLFEQFISTEINLPLLTKLFQYIKKEIGEKNYTALGRAEELVTAIGAVRRAQNMSGRGYVYLWALLHKKENSWLHHVNGSVLGIVLDTAIELRGQDDMAQALKRVTQLLATATSGENYKQKTAESSQASLENAFKFLEEKGLKGTMERRLLPLSEVKSTIWHEQVVVAEEAVETTTSATDAAFSKLLTKKNPDAQANEKMDEILGKIDTDQHISLAEFIRNLDEYVSLSISNKNMRLLPTFGTTSVSDGDHAELLNFATEVGEHASLLNPVQPYIYSAVASLAGYGAAKQDGIIFTGVAQHVFPDIPVNAIFKAKAPGTEEYNYVLNIKGLAHNLQKTFMEHGTCILGTMIKSEHFGMSRPLVELSKQIPMQTEAGIDAAGGIVIGPGIRMSFKAVLKDGTRSTIFITSDK